MRLPRIAASRKAFVGAVLVCVASAAAAQIEPAGSDHEVGDVGSLFSVNQVLHRLAPLPGGGFVVVSQSHTPYPAPEDTDVTAQVFAAPESPVGSPFIVNASTTGRQHLPAVAADLAGKRAYIVDQRVVLDAELQPRHDAKRAPPERRQRER